jgi:hypothetical protein
MDSFFNVAPNSPMLRPCKGPTFNLYFRLTGIDKVRRTYDAYIQT